MRHLTSIPFLLLAPAALAQAAPEPTPSIQVTGTARVSTMPDRARLVYWVNGEGRTADEASAALAARNRAIVAGLGSLLGRETQFSSGEVGVMEVRAPACQRGGGYGAQPQLSTGDCAVVGYVAHLQGTILTVATTRAGTAAGLAARLGARDARAQGFELSDPAAAQQRATTAAITDARAKATAIAASAGVRLGELLTINDSNDRGNITVTGSAPVYAPIAPAAPPAPPPVEIDVKPRPIETTAQVFARFAIVR